MVRQSKLRNFAIAVGVSMLVPTAAVANELSPDALVRLLQMTDRNQIHNQIYTLERQLQPRKNFYGEMLVNALDNNDEIVKVSAATLLNRFASHQDFSLSDRSLATLVALTKATKDAEIRSQLLGVLGNMGPRNETIKATIIETMDKDLETNVKLAAVQALGRFARQERPVSAESTVKILCQVLTRPDSAPALKEAAANALADAHTAPAVAIPALITALDSDFLNVRSYAVRGLCNYGSKSATIAAPKIIEMLKSEGDHGLRSNCLNALSQFGPETPGAMEAMIDALDDRQTRSSAVSYLSHWGKSAAPATKKLIAILKDSEQYTRLNAARTLGQIGPDAKEALPELRRLAREDSYVRSTAEQSIRQIEPPETNQQNGVVGLQ